MDRKISKSREARLLRVVIHGRVQVMDDDPQVRSLLQRPLEQDDYVLLDLKLPKMNRKELFQLVQGNPNGMPDKVLFIIGDTVDLDSQEFVAFYYSPVMHKPFQFDDLMPVVREMTADPTRA